jgi:hypothetical protein
MEHSSFWEANRFSASEEITHASWNPNVHYRIHNSRPPVPILCQIDPVLSPHPTSWRSILLPSKAGSPKWSLSRLFPPPKPCTPLSSPLPPSYSALLSHSFTFFRFFFIIVYIVSGVPREVLGGSNPPSRNSEILTKYQKLRKFYYMKWKLYQITAASRTPD